MAAARLSLRAGALMARVPRAAAGLAPLASSSSRMLGVGGRWPPGTRTLWPITESAADTRWAPFAARRSFHSSRGRRSGFGFGKPAATGSNLRLTVVVSTAAFVIGGGVVFLVTAWLMQPKEEHIQCSLLLVGTQGSAQGVSSFLVYPGAHKIQDMQMLSGLRDVVSMSLSPDQSQVLVLGRSADGVHGYLSLLQVHSDGMVAPVSHLELPENSKGACDVQFLGEFPTHQLAMVCNGSSGSVDVIKIEPSGQMSVAQRIEFTPDPSTGKLGAPQHAMVLAPHVVVPVAGANSAAVFSLAGDQSFQLTKSIPLSPGSSGRLQLLFSKIHQKAFLVNLEQRVVEVIDWSDLEAPTRRFPLPKNSFGGMHSVEGILELSSRSLAPLPELLRSSDPVAGRGASELSHCLLFDGAEPGLLSLDSGLHALSLDAINVFQQADDQVVDSIWSHWSAGLKPVHMTVVADEVFQEVLFVANQESGTVGCIQLGNKDPLLLRSLKVPGASFVLSVPLEDFQVDDDTESLEHERASWKSYARMT